MAPILTVCETAASGNIELPPVVSPAAYTEEYYLTDAEGKEEYVETAGRTLSPRLRKAWDLASIRKGMRVLDLGCGRGEIVLQCALHGARVVGVDYSPCALRLAGAILGTLPEDERGNASLIHSDMRALPFPAGHFDRVFMLDIVEHLSLNELEAVLREVRRVLGKEGRCIIHTMPNRLFWDVGYRFYMKWVDALAKLLIRGKATVRHEGRNHYSLTVHINEQTKKSLRTILKRCGLKGRIWLEDDFFNDKNLNTCSWRELLYEGLMRVWPLSNLWPLNHVFHHSIYAIAAKEG